MMNFKNISGYGLNLLPSYIEIVERELVSSHQKLEQMEQWRTTSTPVDLDEMGQILKENTANQTDGWEFFKQCTEWRNCNPGVEHLRLIARVEKTAAKLERIKNKILSLSRQYQN